MFIYITKQFGYCLIVMSYSQNNLVLITAMPLTREIETNLSRIFFKPIRAIFSGSSQSGKTHLIGEIIKHQEKLFGDAFSNVQYYYPEYLDECPVNWHEYIDTPISYTAGFPTKDDVLSLVENSLLIIDDNMKKVVQSELMRQLFNVISGKKNISVICVTQNYFTQGQFSRDIRNSSNYVVLLRNCADAMLNKRVANAFGLVKAYEAAKVVFEENVYPYMFIDQTQRAQLSNYRLYTDILSTYQVAYNSKGMKGYILSEADFKLAYKILEEKKKSVVATANEDQEAVVPRKKERISREKELQKRKPARERETKKTKISWTRFAHK